MVKKLNRSCTNTGFYILAALHHSRSAGLGTIRQFHRKYKDLAVHSNSPGSEAASCFLEVNPIPGYGN